MSNCSKWMDIDDIEHKWSQGGVTITYEQAKALGAGSMIVRFLDETLKCRVLCVFTLRAHIFFEEPTKAEVFLATVPLTKQELTNKVFNNCCSELMSQSFNNSV